MSQSYLDQQSERLAKMSRVERFAELITFPTEHTTKVIGTTEGFEGVVRAALATLGYADVELSARPSSGGKYVALSGVLHVETAEELDALYTVLEALPGLKYLL